MNKLEEKLKKILKEIWDDDEFVRLTIHTMDTDSKKQKLIDCIEKHNIKNSDDVILISDDIDDGIEPEF